MTEGQLKASLLSLARMIIIDQCDIDEYRHGYNAGSSVRKFDNPPLDPERAWERYKEYRRFLGDRKYRKYGFYDGYQNLSPIIAIGE